MLNWEVNQGLTSTITWPASRVLFAKILLLPTLQSWAIWQDPIIRLLSPITWLCIILVRIWSSLNVIQNFYFENGGKKKKKKQPQQPHHYRPFTWLWRTVDWGMFSDVIIVANIKETFIPWLNDRHIYKRGILYENIHMYINCDCNTVSNTYVQYIWNTVSNIISSSFFFFFWKTKQSVRNLY